MFFERVNLNNRIYVLIPYISNYAYAIYKSKACRTYNNIYPNNIIFLDQCITYLDTFIELCIKKNFNIYEKDVYYLTEKNYNKMNDNEYYTINSLVKDILLLPECGVLIYFDHKIADQASTVQYFLNYSTVLNNIYVLKNLNNDNNEFNRLKRYYNQVNNEYFNKPIEIISDSLKTRELYWLKNIISIYYGNNYFK